MLGCGMCQLSISPSKLPKALCCVRTICTAGHTVIGKQSVLNADWKHLLNQRHVRETGKAPTQHSFLNIRFLTSHIEECSMDPRTEEANDLMKFKVKTLGNTVYDLEMKPDVSCQTAP